MVPGRGEECQRQREPSGARATASSLEERARWVEGWTETPGSGRRRERENSGGEEGKAGHTALGLILLQKFGAEEGRTSPLTESSGFRGSSNIQSLQTAGM